MNYWNLHKKPQHTLKQKLQTLLFGFVNVQKQKRNLFDSGVIIINYALTYVIVFFIIIQSLARQFINHDFNNPSNDPLIFIFQKRLTSEPISNYYFQVITILLLIRLFFALLYIFTQRVSFLTINKILLIVNIFLTEYESTSEDFIAIEMPLFVIETVMIAVWAYKTQRRIRHFDSRLHCRYPLLKDFTVYLMAMLIRRVQKMTFSPSLMNESPVFDTSTKITLFELQAMVVIIVGMGVIVMADYSDFLYNSKFKRILLSLDGLMITLLVTWIILHIFYGQILGFYEQLVITGIMLILLFLGLVEKQNFNKLYQVEPRYLQYQSENWLLEYVQALRKLISSKDQKNVQTNVQMIKFIEFHRSSCLYPVCPFTQRFKISDSVEAKSQLIEEYMLKQLQHLMVTKPLLKKYIIHYLSPKDKVFRYLNQNIQSSNTKSNLNQKQQYVKRQLWRLSQQKKDRTNEIKILQAEIIKEQILSLLEQYLISAKRFYLMLNKDQVNAENLLLYGNKMFELIDKIEFLKQNNASNFTQGVRILVNNFTSRLLQYPKSSILETVIDPPYLIHKTTQTCPTLLVSAEPQNFLSIIDANIACTKEFYVKREDFIKLKATDLLPEQIKKLHLAYFNKISKKIEFDGVKNFPKSLFVSNKFGYATFFIGDIYSFYSIKGRIWCVAIEVVHKMKSIILIAKQGNGKIMGISQMAVFHGFNISDKGKQFTQEFFASILIKNQGSSSKYKKVKVEAYDTIFENSDFHFMQTKTMQIIEQNTAFGFTYYLVEVRSLQQNFGRRQSRSTILSRSIVSIDENSQISISDQQVNYKAKHQFHYHSDGVVRLYEQQPDNIKQNFNQNTSTQSNSEVQLPQQLGQGIVQMRLMGDHIDFLENIEKQIEFKSKPLTQLEKKQHQIDRFDLTCDFYKECLKNRQQEIPKWLIYTRIVFIVLTILFLSALIFMYVQNTINVKKIHIQSQIISSISDNELNLIQLSKLLLGYKFYESNYLKHVSMRENIAKIIAKFEQNSKFLNDLDPRIANYFSTGTLQSVLSSYFIAFNTLSSMTDKQTLQKFNQQPILKDLTQKIVPGYNTIISQKLSQFLSDLSSSQRLNIMLIFLLDLLTVVIWIWSVGIYRRVYKLRNHLIYIVSKIPDRYIDKQLVKLALFQQYLHFDKDIYCEDDIQYIMQIRRQMSQQNYQSKQNNETSGPTSNKKRTIYKRKNTGTEDQFQEINAETNHKIMSQKKIDYDKATQQNQNTYIKKIIQPKNIGIKNIVGLLWTLTIVIINYFFCSQINQYSYLSQKIILLQQNLYRIQSNSDTVWLLLNKFPYNNSQIDFYEWNMYSSVSDFKAGLVQINRDGVFSRDFIEIMENLWTGDCCKYIGHNTPNCSFQLNGALGQGANQIIAFLNRKYDTLIDQQLSLEYFHHSPIASILSNLQLHYFSQIKSLNQKMIFQQHNQLRDKYERVFFGYFIVIILCFAVIGVIYKLVAMENQALIKVEQFFKLIEFDSLKNVKEFKLYIKETYYDKIFK